MDCETFERLYPDFLRRRLSRDGLQEMQAHLAICDECRLLIEEPPSEDAPDLTRAILASTTGSSCGRLRELACAFVDGELDEPQAALVGGHLEHCPDCSALVAGLTELKRVLPTFAMIDPGPAFAAEVLRTTSRMPAFNADPWADFLEFWRRLFRRPRICFEAAYVGTLAGVLALNIPIPRLRADGGSVRIAGVIQSKNLLQPILASSRDLASAVAGSGERCAGSIHGLIRHGQEETARTISRGTSEVDRIWKRVSGDLREGFRRNERDEVEGRHRSK